MARGFTTGAALFLREAGSRAQRTQGSHGYRCQKGLRVNIASIKSGVSFFLHDCWLGGGNSANLGRDV